jgi:hypothetical protein
MLIVGFQHEAEARRCQEIMRARLKGRTQRVNLDRMLFGSISTAA